MSCWQGHPDSYLEEYTMDSINLNPQQTQGRTLRRIQTQAINPQGDEVVRVLCKPLTNIFRLRRQAVAQ